MPSTMGSQVLVRLPTIQVAMGLTSWRHGAACSMAGMVTVFLPTKKKNINDPGSKHWLFMTNPTNPKDNERSRKPLK